MKSVHEKIILDPEYMDLLDEYTWSTSGQKGNEYPRTHTERINGKNHSKKLHHFILPKKEGFEIDHINRNRFDNRRCNLRYVTPSQNQWNKSMEHDNKSGFRGVSWHSLRNKWRARIHYHDKEMHLGLYDTPEEASSVYIAVARELFGEFLGEIIK
jgi:hypothetical protein